MIKTLISLAFSSTLVGCVCHHVDAAPPRYMSSAAVEYNPVYRYRPAPIVQFQPDCTPVYRERINIPYYVPVPQYHCYPGGYFPQSSVSFGYSRSRFKIGVNIF